MLQFSKPIHHTHLDQHSIQHEFAQYSNNVIAGNTKFHPNNSSSGLNGGLNWYWHYCLKRYLESLRTYVVHMWKILWDICGGSPRHLWRTLWDICGGSLRRLWRISETRIMNERKLISVKVLRAIFNLDMFSSVTICPFRNAIDESTLVTNIFGKSE